MEGARGWGMRGVTITIVTCLVTGGETLGGV